MQSQISNKFSDFFRIVEASKKWARIVMVTHEYATFDAIKAACKDADLVLHQDYVVFGEEVRFSSNTNMMKAVSKITNSVFKNHFTLRYENLDVDMI